METTTIPEPDDASRRAVIEDRIERFAKPTCLDPQLVPRVLPRLKELARLAGPTTPEDAKNLLTAGCRLIADTVPADDEGIEVDVVLSEEVVARWSHAAKRAGMNPGTLANSLRFLNRLVRARNGLPPRVATRRTSLKRPTLPERARLHRLAAGLAETDPASATALIAAAGAGLLATSEPVSLRDGEQPMAVQGDRSVRIGAGWHALARRLTGTTADPAAWARLRAAATTDGLALRGPGMRLRWAVDAAAVAATPRAAVQAGIPRDLLNQAIVHLPPVDDETARKALRG